MTLGTAIIVGVGPGLGLSLARTFANAGHPVAMVARDSHKLEAFVEEINASGVEARAYSADATNASELRSTLDEAITNLGAPEVLVYNAALLRQDSATDGDDAGWANAISVGMLGAKIAAEVVLPMLRGG